jgi:hypothetical protein
LPPLFQAHGAVCARIHDQLYSLKPDEKNWERDSAPTSGSSKYFDDGVLVRNNHPPEDGSVWGMFGGMSSLELLFFQGANAKAPPTPPRWPVPHGIWIGAYPCCLGENSLWSFVGSPDLHPESNGRHAILMRFAQGVAEPLIIPIRFAFPPAQFATRSAGPPMPGSEILFQSTPSGLVVISPSLRGFWLIPKADLAPLITRWSLAQSKSTH